MCGGCRDAGVTSGIFGHMREAWWASRHPGMNMPRRRKEQSQRGGGNVFEVALVFLALNGNTIIFAALHFQRKPHRALRLLDI